MKRKGLSWTVLHGQAWLRKNKHSVGEVMAQKKNCPSSHTVSCRILLRLHAEISVRKKDKEITATAKSLQGPTVRHKPIYLKAHYFKEKSIHFSLLPAITTKRPCGIHAPVKKGYMLSHYVLIGRWTVLVNRWILWCVMLLVMLCHPAHPSHCS